MKNIDKNSGDVLDTISLNQMFVYIMYFYSH